MERSQRSAIDTFYAQKCLNFLLCISSISPLSPQGEPSSLDHSFSSVKDDLSLCDDSLLPTRKIIGDRGGPASMKENICQVSFQQ